jgi:16S rRNA (adenine1518-N6/adenine1519-N6)-dimethyltransferase
MSQGVLLEETRALLRQYRLHPRKALGQHFLVDADVLAAVVEAAGLLPTDTVLEVGPGIGLLTDRLARSVRHVVAIELDDDLARIVADRFGTLGNVTVRHANVLHADLSADLAAGEPFKVVANIPYYITAPILRLFLEGRTEAREGPTHSQSGPTYPLWGFSPAGESGEFSTPRHEAEKEGTALSTLPAAMVLMVQREVAERIAARPGKMSLLSLSAQLFAEPEIVRLVPATAFYPPPEVQSAIVRLRRRPHPAVDPHLVPIVFRVARAAFHDRRKQLHNALAIGIAHLGPERIDGALLAAGIDRRRRAETLSVEEWGRLAEAFAGLGLLGDAAPLVDGDLTSALEETGGEAVRRR